MNKTLFYTVVLFGVFFGSTLLAYGSTCAGVFVGGTGVCYGNGYVGGILAHTILVGEGANQIATITPSTSGYVLTSNGVSADPTFQPATGGGSGNVSTSSAETSTYIPFWTSTAASPATLSGGTSNLTWNGTKLFANQASTTLFTSTGNTYLASAGGNVGIGTTSPNYALTINASGSSGDVGALITSASAGSTALFLQNTNGGKQWSIKSTGGGAGVGGAKLLFKDETDSLSAMVIDSSGNVGIGTTSPFARLSVDTSNLGAGVPEFDVGSSTRTDLLVNQNGYVGIGTTTPYSQLAITGNLTLGASAAGGTPGDLYLPKLGTSAGSFLAVDATGKVIATTTPSGGGGSGTVTSIATNNGITGGTITTSGTIGLAAIAANSVLANITGGSAVPTALATSSLFTFPWSIANGGTATTTGGNSNTVEYYNGTTLTNSKTLTFNGTTLTMPAPGSTATLFIIGSTTSPYSGAGGIATSYFNAPNGTLAGESPTYVNTDAGMFANSNGESGSGQQSESIYAYGQALNSSMANSNYGILAEEKGSTSLSTGVINAAVYALQDSSFTNSLLNYGVYSSGGDNYFGGNTGFGSSTPWAQLSVNAPAGSPEFAIGSSTATNFLVDKNGFVGIATTSPSQGALLGIAGGVFSSGTVYANNFFDTSVSGSTCVGETNGLLGTSNCVSSLASSGSTISVSSPTGAVNVDLNLAHANSWSALQTFANATTTLLSASYASSTLYYGAGLTSCNGATNALTWAAGQFGCNTISASSGTVTNIATTWPLSGGPITTTGTLTWAGLATTSNPTSGNIFYSNGTTGLVPIATTSESITGPFNVPTGYGALVGGSGSVKYWGLATTTQPSATNLLVSNGAAGVYGVATSTLTASSPLTGSFTQIGSGGALGLGTVGFANGGTGTTTFYTSGVPFSDGSKLTLSSGLAGTAFDWDNTNFRLGIGTTTPFATLSVNAAAGAWPFAIGSSTLSDFAITPYGQVTLSEERAATSTTYTLDWGETAEQILYQTGTSATTITLTDATTSVYNGSRKMLVVCNSGSNAGALTFVGVEWAGATVPTQTTTANQCDTYSFFVTAATSTAASPTFKVFGAASTGFQ